MAKKIALLIAAFALTICAVSPVSAPAHAVSAATVKCAKTTEVCRATLSKPTLSRVIVTTGIPTGSASARAHYAVRIGKSGKIFCQGSMRYKQQISCNIGAYRGAVTFEFYKGHGVAGAVTIAG